MMKKLTKLLICLTLVISMTIIPKNVDAASEKTLGQLKKEIADYKAKKTAATDNKNKTQTQINANKDEVYKKQTQVETTQNKIADTKSKIQDLNTKMEEKKKEINDVLADEEVSDSDNTYLEYLFGAKTISDFIIRYSIGGQVTDYTNSLVEDYKDTIEDEEELQQDLSKQESTLQSQINDLNKTIESLGDDLQDYTEEENSYDDVMSATQAQIDKLNKNGCKDSQTLSQCLYVKTINTSRSSSSSSSSSKSSSYSGSVAPSNPSGFMRPISNGTITSPYGWRYHPTLHYSRLHAGLDIGVRLGTPVYATISGTVGLIIRGRGCGGNQVYIYHNVNGSKITSGYMHLQSINVSEGQQVTSNTVIGYSGGVYDSCSTGPHLHFGMYYGWTASSSSSFDPHKYVNFPNTGGSFYSR